MNSLLIEKNDPRVTELSRQMEKTGITLEKLKNHARRCFNGRRFLTDSELSGILKISRRSLQQYRSAGIIPYYLICGKVIYEESEIQQLLENSRKQSPDIRDLL